MQAPLSWFPKNGVHGRRLSRAAPADFDVIRIEERFARFHRFGAVRKGNTMFRFQP
jgi:hypothetical protein